jgi:caffeoyl-CoA O-methyltransferase
MKPIVSPDIEAYAARHCVPETPVLRELVAVTRRDTEAPQMQVGRIEGALLRVLARSVRAKRVIEIGTFTGYSALCFAEALPDDGEVITCDINPETTAIARSHWAKSPHGKKIRLELGPAAETIRKLPGEFDFAFIDADKENYPTYWELLAPRIRSGGMIVIDNALWSGAVLDRDPDEETRAIMNASRMASEDPRYDTALVTVRDGMLVAIRK